MIGTVKAAILTALTVPLMFAGSGLAQANPNDPLPFYAQDQQCADTQQFVDKVHETNPSANPDQIADTYTQVMDQQDAYHGDLVARDRARQDFIGNIWRCGLAH